MRQRNVPTSRLVVVRDTESRLIISRRPDLKIGALVLAAGVFSLHLAIWIYDSVSPIDPFEPSFPVLAAGWFILLSTILGLMRAGTHLEISRFGVEIIVRRGFLLRRPLRLHSEQHPAFRLRHGLFQDEKGYKEKVGIRTMEWWLEYNNKKESRRGIMLDEGADGEVLRDMARKAADAAGLPLHEDSLVNDESGTEKKEQAVDGKLQEKLSAPESENSVDNVSESEIEFSEKTGHQS